MTLAGLRKRTLGSGRTARSVVGTRSGWLLAFRIYGLGAVHLYLIPRTGGLTGLVWNATLYDLLTDATFVNFVHVPLMQAPLAVMSYRGVRSGPAPRVRLPRFERELTVGPPAVLGGFVLLAVLVGLLTALGGAPVPAGVAGALVGSLRWGMGWSLVFGLYVLYFPLLGLALFVGRN